MGRKTKTEKTRAAKPRAAERAAEKEPAPDISWAAIFGALEKWSKKALEAETPPVTMASVDIKGPDHAPAVNVIAGETSRDPLAVLVSTVLSLRTKDEVTLVTSQRLLEKAPTPAKMRSLSEEAVAALAYPAGFYRTKAASLKKIAEILLDSYGGKVPDDMESLLALPGVGRKTEPCAFRSLRQVRHLRGYPRTSHLKPPGLFRRGWHKRPL